jgi:hypothetical protein
MPGQAREEDLSGARLGRRARTLRSVSWHITMGRMVEGQVAVMAEMKSSATGGPNRSGSGGTCRSRGRGAYRKPLPVPFRLLCLEL